MIYRPRAVIIDGRLEEGLELEVEEGVICSLRSSSRKEEPYVISPAFVNGHSHMEYWNFRYTMSHFLRSLKEHSPDSPEGKPKDTDQAILSKSRRASNGATWAKWVQELQRLKAQESPQDSRTACFQAAQRQKLNGIAFVWEHSDRPGSAEAMKTAGLDGRVFQEVITFRERLNPLDKLELIRSKAETQARESGLPVTLNPHSLYLVDQETLSSLSSTQNLISIHFGESVWEELYLNEGRGIFAQWEEALGFKTEKKGLLLDFLDSLGLLRRGVQLVHCCVIDPFLVSKIADSGVSVCLCPVSNHSLECPIPPVRNLIDAGVPLSLGTDSAASGSFGDLRQEMAQLLLDTHSVDYQERAFFLTSGAAYNDSPDSVTTEEVWRIATEGGAEALGLSGWKIQEGNQVPLIAFQPEKLELESLIWPGEREEIQWVNEQRKPFSM
ncbi:MAG: amidohydrolase family protein [Fimbriimonadaceae bacterium]|jgi:cytosine/adenosine deaminase-related metal-dependent hydrolase|nr:amidohydrolase family protein [Fimbriimonadaceae bacterium]